MSKKVDVVKMKPTLKEARQIALFFYQSCLVGSIVIGSLIFFGIACIELTQPRLIFFATLCGAVFGWHLVLPMFGQFFLKDIDNKVPGLGDATVSWFRHARPGDFLDLRKLAAQVGARDQHRKR